MTRPVVVAVLIVTTVAGCQRRKPGAQEPGVRSGQTSPGKIATDEASAVMLYKEHVHRMGWSAHELSVSARPFGGRWLIYSAHMGIQPSISSLHVMNDKGKVYNDLIDGLTICHMNEFRSSEDPAVHRRLVESFITLHCGDGDRGEPMYLSSASDIPGYEKKPLPADMERVIRPAWSYTDSQGDLVYVVYTYNKIGGTVRRYTFVFGKEKSFRRATCTELGRDIGDAAYYE